MGYKYSIWLIPNNWKDIKNFYKMNHIPHITIKTLLSYDEALKLFKNYDNKYKVNFKDNIYDFKNLSYHHEPKNEFPASGYFCKIENLELEHKPHMTIHYKYNDKVIYNKSPNNIEGTVFIVNTISDNPEEWNIITII